jgi:hypothetical protein
MTTLLIFAGQLLKELAHQNKPAVIVINNPAIVADSYYSLQK